jgi:hypothetical protein
MKTFKVNADFYINVQVEVEAETEEEAKSEAKQQILAKNCEWMDPITDPVINWAEQIDDDDEDTDGCDCDLI